MRQPLQTSRTSSQKTLQVAIELNDMTESLELKWDGHDLMVQSPTDSKVRVSVVDTKSLPSLPNIARSNKSGQNSRISSRQMSNKKLDHQSSNKKVEIPLKVEGPSPRPTNASKASNNPASHKKHKKISRKRRGELALQSIKHMYSEKIDLGMQDSVLKDMKLVFVDHKGMNEKAMSDIALLPMIAQFDRFEKNSVENEEWHYEGSSHRSRATKTDKRSRNMMANKTPVYGVFDVVYDENESNLEFVKYVFKPLVESDAFIPDVKHMLTEKSFMDDATLQCVPSLFDGTLHRLNVIDKSAQKPRNHQTHIVHTFDFVPKSKSTEITPMKLPILQKQTSQPKMQAPHRSQNDTKTFQKRTQQRS